MRANPNIESLDEPLIQIIEDHVARERDAIDLYHHLQTELPDPVVASILRLIVADEEHHHRALRVLANALRLGQTKGRPVVPRVIPGGSDRSVLSETAAQLEAAGQDERDGAERFRQLARAERNRGNLFTALLFELMALDSEKHELMLSYAVEEIRAGSSGELIPSEVKGAK